MKITTDTPAANIVEFRQMKSSHSLKMKQNEGWKLVRDKETGKTFYCQHNALIVDERREMVTCKTCGDEMSLLEAMRLLYRRIWWEENSRERQLDYDGKRVSRVQSAAFTCLYEAGVTPERYAERWNKERALRLTQMTDKPAEGKAERSLA